MRARCAVGRAGGTPQSASGHRTPASTPRRSPFEATDDASVDQPAAVAVSPAPASEKGATHTSSGPTAAFKESHNTNINSSTNTNAKDKLNAKNNSKHKHKG